MAGRAAPTGLPVLGGDGIHPGGGLQAPCLLGCAVVAESTWAIGRLAADSAGREAGRDRPGRFGAELVFERRELDAQHVRAAGQRLLIPVALATGGVGANVIDPS